MRMISRSMRGRCSFTGCAARSRWSLTRSFPCPTCPIRTLECQICNCWERTRWTSQRSKLIVWHVDGAFISFVFAYSVAFWVEGNEHLSFVYYRIKRDRENNFFTSLADVCHRNRLMLHRRVCCGAIHVWNVREACHAISDPALWQEAYYTDKAFSRCLPNNKFMPKALFVITFSRGAIHISHWRSVELRKVWNR